MTCCQLLMHIEGSAIHFLHNGTSMQFFGGLMQPHKTQALVTHFHAPL